MGWDGMGRQIQTAKPSAAGGGVRLNVASIFENSAWSKKYKESLPDLGVSLFAALTKANRLRTVEEHM